MQLNFRTLVIFTCALALGVALAPPPAQAEETEPHLVGVGYKIGNGLGFLGGDVIVRALPHVALGSAGKLLFGVGHELGERLRPGPDPAVPMDPGWPHALPGAGLPLCASLVGRCSASASGVLLNAGYEWRFASGVGILLGGGAAYLGNIQATNGIDTLTRAGGWHFNIEAGLRYYFLAG